MKHKEAANNQKSLEETGSEDMSEQIGLLSEIYDFVERRDLIGFIYFWLEPHKFGS